MLITNNIFFSHPQINGAFGDGVMLALFLLPLVLVPLLLKLVHLILCYYYWAAATAKTAWI